MLVDDALDQVLVLLDPTMGQHNTQTSQDFDFDWNCYLKLFVKRMIDILDLLIRRQQTQCNNPSSYP